MDPETEGTDTLPEGPGAYVLVIEVERAVPIRIPRLPRIHLPPGRYAYVGSAKGGGGIRARVRRHLSARETPHWHIDQLTGAAKVSAVVVHPGAEECDIVDGLLADHGATTPLPGFGSSDCKRCVAHLVALP